MATYINQILVYSDGKNRKIGAADDLEIGGNFEAASFTGSASGLTAIPAGELTGALPALDGSALTSLDGSNISSGTVAAARLPATVVYSDAASTTFTNGVSALSFSGDGSALTNLSAAQLTGALPAIDGANLTNLDADNISSGTVADARLSANVAKYNDAAPTFTHTVSAAGFSGSGASLTSLDADELTTGTVADARLSANVPLLNAGSNTFTGSISATSFSGSGSSLTGLDADELTTGTVADARLSANVALYDAASPTFTNTVSAAAFSGAGGSLTGLNAGNVTTGTLSDGRLSANVALYDAAAPTFTNTVSAAGFSGSGASLTSLDADELTTGTVADARLSANVALLNAASQTFTGNVAIGGNLNVTGDIISGGAVNVVLADQFLDLNGNNLLGTATSGGIAVNVLSTGSTFDVESFTAGGTGTDPTVVVTGDASALAAGDLIQISQSASSNDGQYIVYSATYNGGTGKTTIAVRGNAASAHPASTYPQLPFVHNQFSTATEAAKLTAITLGVMAVSNGGLYAAGPAAIALGEWCYNYGASVSDFENSWVSLAPVAAQTLQGAYDASSSPADIQLVDAKGFRILAPTSGTAQISLQSNAASDITVNGDTFEISASRIALNTGNVIIGEAAGINGISVSGLSAGTIGYVDPSSGNISASDQASNTDAALEVDGVVLGNSTDLATVFGTKVTVQYTGSAPVLGDVVYLAGGADAGKCQVAIPTSGRVTKLGKCVVSGSDGACVIIWSPDYIADL